MNKFLSAALFVNLFLVSPFHVVASDEDATAVYLSSPDVIDRGLGTTSFLSDNSAKSATTRMLHSLKGTNNFIPPHDKRKTSPKMTNFQSNNRQEPHVKRNMLTQKFLTKSELQTAVNEYCSNPSEWVNHPKYATYGPIIAWDVSLITDMRALFYAKSKCNPDIGSWDVSAVTTFYKMFYGATEFNQDIGSWDVSNGVDFQSMFIYASAFNQDIGNWDVSNGVYFSSMFYYASAFNQDIVNWDVSNGVTFYGMFYRATAFNQDIGSWDVSNGVYFSSMFYNATSFNQDIGSWDVSNGVYFYGMFYRATAFNQDIGNWDVSNGVTFGYMFYNALVFRQNLCGWDKSSSSTNTNFCTGSYCGGDCSPTSEPSSAPSKIYSEVPSSIPTVNPSTVPSIFTSKTCNVDDVFDQTLFLPHDGACWRVQLALGGTLEADFTDVSCSKTDSEWQSTNGVYSIFATISVLDETAVFIPGTNGFSGTFQFVEDPTVTQASLQLLSWDPTTKVFATEVTISTCSADADVQL